MKLTTMPTYLILLPIFQSLVVHWLTSAELSPGGVCSYEKGCSQTCTNGSCACIDGFIMGADGKSCMPIDMNWIILFNTKDTLGYLTRNGDGAELQSADDSRYQVQVKSMSFDARNELVYCVVQVSSAISKGTAVVDRRMLYSQGESVIMNNTDLLSPESVAFDWISGNLYYIATATSLRSIIVCGNATGNIINDCALVLTRPNISTEHSIILSPNFGMMFWVEISDDMTVIQGAGMDGQFIRIIEKSRSSPILGIAVDQGSSRIYWTVEGTLESSEFDGTMRRTINLGHSKVSVFSVFGDKFFWPEKEGKTLSIQFAHKITGVDKTLHNVVDLRTPSDMHQFALYHVANQPIMRKNPCTNNSECSHICVLSPPDQLHNFKCLCPLRIHSPLRFGSFACYSNSFCTRPSGSLYFNSDDGNLVVAYENTLSFISPKYSSDKQFSLKLTRFQMSQLSSIHAIAYNPLNHTLILADHKQIFERDITSGKLLTLMENAPGIVISVGIDAGAGNVYWIDNRAVFVVSLATKQVIKLLDVFDDPCEMLVVPDKRTFLLATRNHSIGGINITSYTLDGSSILSEYYDELPTNCITWTYHEASGHIMWAERNQTDGIDVIRLEANGTMTPSAPILLLDNRTHSPNSISSFKNAVFWMDSNSFNITRMSSTSGDISILSRPILTEGELCHARYEATTQFQTSMVEVNKRSFQARSKLRGHPCMKMQCSHVCILAMKRTKLGESEFPKCHCPTGYKLEDNLRMCTAETNDFGILEVALITVGVIFLVLICGGCILLAYVRKIVRNRRRVLTEEEIKEFFKGRTDGSQTYEKLGYDKTAFEIPKTSFKIDTDKILGSGEYGVVFKGSVSCEARLHCNNPSSVESMSRNIRNVQVDAAVKTCKAGSASALRGLMSEIKIMAYLGRHSNVVGFIGAFTHDLTDGLAYLFVEFCELGSLLSYLRRQRPKDPPTAMDFIRWAEEIADGLEYLAAKKVVHADVATRNILLNTNKSAKISDFGLSRRLYNYSEYVKQNQEPLPWRWMAPESLTKMEFTEKSDVWAFGVLLWEIYSGGSTPYPGLSWDQDFAGKLLNGFRLEKPESCADNMYEVMIRCWTVNVEMRPAFSNLKPEIVRVARSYLGASYTVYELNL